tara:strand:- start:1109 stop:1537 length:429 start_codon:yes stop_codon:yes gene_type:complete
MSDLDTTQALITKFIATTVTGLTDSDIDTELDFFDPKGKSIFVKLINIPATSTAMGKSSTDKNEERGIFQVSIFIPMTTKNRRIVMSTAADQVKAGFQFNSTTVYNGQLVTILDSTLNQGRESESWFQRDVSINYLTFSDRG